MLWRGKRSEKRVRLAVVGSDAEVLVARTNEVVYALLMTSCTQNARRTFNARIFPNAADCRAVSDFHLRKTNQSLCIVVNVLYAPFEAWIPGMESLIRRPLPFSFGIEPSDVKFISKLEIVGAAVGEGSSIRNFVNWNFHFCWIVCNDHAVPFAVIYKLK